MQINAISYLFLFHISISTASFFSYSIRNLLAKETTFCPKKHFRANQTCFMYFLLEESLESALKYCNNFSNRLVSLENVYKWEELKDQLRKFNLFKHKFKIGLKSINNEWKWLTSNDGNYTSYDGNSGIDLHFCDQSYKNNASLNKCAYLVHLAKEWCIQIISCDESTKFVCEWSLSNYKQYNSSLSALLRYTFLTLFLLSLIVLIFLLLLLYQFIIKSQQYMVLYRRDNKFNLAYQIFKTKNK